MQIRREMYLKKLEMYIDRPVVKIITGVRRCGKSTIVRQFIDELKESNVPEENIIYLNFEGVLYSYLRDVSELREMLASFIEQTAGRCYIFLDEVQCVKNWAQAAAELMNLFECDIYAVSSNCTIFKDDFAKVLGYRYVLVDVYPLTFNEYLQITADEPGHSASAAGSTDEAGTVTEPDGVDDGEGGSADGGAAGKLSMQELFEDYLRRGGMPGAYAIGNPADAWDYLGCLYNSIILKDAVQCNSLRDISHIDKIMEYVLSHIGTTFSPKGIKDYVKSRGVTISVDTVYSFLDALQGAFLIYKVPRYDIKAGRALETQEKYYVCDIAMRNAAMNDEGAGLEASMENALSIELMTRGFKLYVGKNNQAQVDFMAVKGEDRTYLNCCRTVTEKEAAKQAFGVLTRIRDNYFKMVLSMDDKTIINKGGIINYPITSFMSQG